MDNKEFADSLMKSIKKYGEVDEEGNLFIKDFKGKTKIGSFKEKEISPQETKVLVGKTYEEIIKILKEYTDLREEYYSIIAVWIIGTYLHDGFSSYPYLFLNAMRGSGKSRLLSLIASMSLKGRVLGSPTESVMFRMPKGETVCLDEFEGIMRKGNEGLREILNASYKKGMTVMRNKKKKSMDGEEYVTEEFEPYKPICMANIWGMEEVLGDRCITLTLEKSNNQIITKIIEDFSENTQISAIKSRLEAIQCSLCGVVSQKNYVSTWNKYITHKYTHTYIEETTLNTQEEINLELFNKIDALNINGRNLELFLPLMIISDLIGDKSLKVVLNVAKQLNSEKRHEEQTESYDVALFEFISQMKVEMGYLSVSNVSNKFRVFLGVDADEKWINAKWVGRAIKRLNLVIDRRRMAGGMQVRLDVNKAKDKCKIFGK